MNFLTLTKYVIFLTLTKYVNFLTLTKCVIFRELISVFMNLCSILYWCISDHLNGGALDIA